MGRCGQTFLQGHQRRGGGSGSGGRTAGRSAKRSVSFSAKARQRSRSASAIWARASAALTKAARSSSRASSWAMVSRAATRSSAKLSRSGPPRSALDRWASEWALGGRCSLGAHWAPAQFSSSCRMICQRFRLSRKAGNSPASMARMMVRRLTFANWAAWAGDRWGEVGEPSGRSVGKVGTVG